MLMQARPLPPLLGLTDYLDEMVRFQGPRMRRRSGSVGGRGRLIAATIGTIMEGEHEVALNGVT